MLLAPFSITMGSNLRSKKSSISDKFINTIWDLKKMTHFLAWSLTLLVAPSRRERLLDFTTFFNGCILKIWLQIIGLTVLKKSKQWNLSKTECHLPYNNYYIWNGKIDIISTQCLDISNKSQYHQACKCHCISKILVGKSLNYLLIILSLRKNSMTIKLTWFREFTRLWMNGSKDWLDKFYMVRIRQILQTSLFMLNLRGLKV